MLGMLGGPAPGMLGGAPMLGILGGPTPAMLGAAIVAPSVGAIGAGGGTIVAPSVGGTIVAPSVGAIGAAKVALSTGNDAGTVAPARAPRSPLRFGSSTGTGG